MSSKTVKREINHSKKLARNDPELIWGWNTPAGHKRALRRAQIIIDRTQLQAGQYVLEIGCGTGLFSNIFANVGVQLLAVDISPELLEIAKKNKIPGNSVRFLLKRFEDCNVEGPFDAIIGSSVLHHLDIEKAVEKIFQLLKPGGVMCFAEPNMLNPQIYLQKNIPWLKKMLGDSPDETAFFRWTIKNLLEEKGFKDITITPFDWLHPATPSILINSIHTIGQTLEKIPGIREFSGSLLIHSYRGQK